MKYFLSLLLLFVGVFIPKTFAQDVTPPQTEMQIYDQSATEAATESVEEYTLPYPGILPDNPLYSLKTLRDRLVSFLISDPAKQAEFNLLQADKRLQAGIYLIQKSKNYTLAEQTISKGENYFEDAIATLMEAEKQGKDIGSFQDKLLKSSKKHKEIINDLAKKSPSENKKAFTTLVKRIDAIGKKLEKMMDK